MIICQRGKSEFDYHHGSISDLSHWPVLYGVVVTIAGRSIWTSLSRQKVEIKLLKLAEATLNLPVGLFRCVLCTIWIRCCMSLCSVFWSVLSESVNMVPINCVYRFQGSPNQWEPVRFDRLPVKPVRPGYRSNRSGPVTGQTGPARLRFGPVSNRPQFKIQIWIQKNKNSQTGHTDR